MAKVPKPPKIAEPAPTASVSAQVLATFAEAVAGDQELGAAMSARLKKALVEEREFSDAALRQAMFGDADP